MNHIGTHPLETERLILRRYVPEDAAAMFRNWASNDEVTKYLTWPTHPNAEITRGLIENHWLPEYEKPNTYHWGLVEKDTGELFGDIAVVCMNEDIAEAELGWCMGKAWWGKGYMPEAASAVLRVLFEQAGFNRVCAKHDVNNPKSGRVMQKIGMRLEGVHRQAGRNNQGIVDMAVYAILKRDCA